MRKRMKAAGSPSLTSNQMTPVKLRKRRLMTRVEMKTAGVMNVSPIQGRRKFFLSNLTNQMDQMKVSGCSYRSPRAMKTAAPRLMQCPVKSM